MYRRTRIFAVLQNLNWIHSPINYYLNLKEGNITSKKACLFKHRVYVPTPLNCITPYPTSEPHIRFYKN